MSTNNCQIKYCHKLIVKKVLLSNNNCPKNNIVKTCILSKNNCQKINSIKK